MDPLRFLVLAFVGAVAVFGIAFSVHGIVVEMRYRRSRRSASSEAGAGAVGADIDSVLTNLAPSTPVRAASAIVADTSSRDSCCQLLDQTQRPAIGQIPF